MKILFVITSLGMGGAEHMVTSLADELASRKNDVKIIYLTGDAIVKPKNKLIELIPIDMKSSRDFIKAYHVIRNTIKSYKPDIVHSHMYHANIISRLVRLSTDIPKLICTSHSSNEGGKLRMLSYRFTQRLADLSTNVSHDAVSSLIAKGAVKENNIVCIPNGVDTDKFSRDYIARETKRKQLDIGNKMMILAVGRFHEAKDYPNLLQSISRLSKIRDDFKLYIIGEGPLKEDIVKLSEQLKISEFIEFLGERNDIRELMSACDLYVMSSAWEGLPMVILEAMSTECVIVSTDCGGVAEALGTAGFLVEPKNSIALSNIINHTLNLPLNERKYLGKAARQRVEDSFSLSSNVNAYLEIYIS